MSAPKPRVDLDTTLERLLRLGLAHAAEQLGEGMTAAVKESVSPHRFLDELLDTEFALARSGGSRHRCAYRGCRLVRR